MWQRKAEHVTELEARLTEKELEISGLRTCLEEALREEVADSDPARLRAARQKADDLAAGLAAKQVTVHVLVRTGRDFQLRRVRKCTFGHKTFQGEDRRACWYAWGK